MPHFLLVKVRESRRAGYRLSQAGNEASGSDLYVTLEPCSTTGRTPPCTDAIIKAGIRRVFVGCLDPNPAHAGRGVEILRSAGIETSSGIEEEQCRRLNEAFFKWITTRIPFVLLKMAMTLDGKTATEGGVSKWITGPAARMRVQKLRRWADAIMVGGETARVDRPSLNVRFPANWPFQPRRIVATSSMTEESLQELLPSGRTPEIFNYKKESWSDFLLRLGSENMTSLLIEGGSELAASALNAGIVDRIEFHVAPLLLGGKDSRPVLGGQSPVSLSEALKLKDLSIRKLGCDFIFSGRPER
ncbi:MAG: riboflavin biosynthesis protein RibD [Lentisphaerae bacterium GWF2_45_14]|nr:MAG: riboflavin biosynthesis protein RibD [Lentisphaerae bacterium GWF2_45_14]